MEQKNNSKVVIVLLSIIIVILLTLVVLLGTGIIDFKKDITEDNSSKKVSTSTKVNIGKKETKKEFTEEDAESKLKELYSDAVRGIFNEKVAFCGTYESNSINLNGFTYKKSSSFKSFDELDAYVKKYMTEELLSTTDYNKKVDLDGTTITSYYEKDGSLYCNNWNKGGNIDLANYLVNESTFTISNLTDTSFDGVIKAVYSNDTNTNKTTKNIKISVIMKNNNWLINSYVEE